MLGVTGELLLTAGVLLLLYVVYVLWGTGLATEREQDQLRERTIAAWSDPSSVPAGDSAAGTDDESRGAGDGADTDTGTEALTGYALLRIPRLGAAWEWVVVGDVTLADLARGPGHYPGSADPGEIGNLAIAGHRAGHGAPFAHLDRLQPGDTIEVENAEGVWTYTVDRTGIVMPSDTWVVTPVPGQPGATPTESLLTLTTCHPRWGSEQRLVVFASLAEGA